MSGSHLSSPPVDPFSWRESVLSTRSISYVSTADAAMGSPGLPPPGGMTHARGNPARSHARQNNTTDSDAGLEMGGAQREHELDDIAELPDSVAESLLFTLPREIRDRIYQFCLSAKENRQIEWPTMRKAFGMQAQLIRTCEIIYNEAAPLLYTLNTMTFHHPSDANMFSHVFARNLARHVTHLSLHIKAQDTRLWMPYLTSKELKRSLKADFPGLRDLNIRFRSNKWQHALSPDHNMRLWSEDSRLDEVVDGLRHVFLHTSVRDPRNQEEFEAHVSSHSEASPLDPSDPQFKKQWLDIHKARTAFAVKSASTPTIRVVCACRVHVSHFNALTGEGPPVVPPIAAGALGLPRPRSPPDEPPTAVREGEPFRGFTSLDLRNGTRKLQDPDLGSANVARTPFADKDGVLLALELHSLDPKSREEGR